MKINSKKQTCDIAIIGGGITGLSTCYHLISSSFKTILIDSKNDPMAERSTDLFFGGLVDNITRIHHNHGEKIARDIWQFSIDSYRYLKDFLAAEKITYQTFEKLRIHNTEDQIKEGEEAHQLLSSFGYNSDFFPRGKKGFKSGDRVHSEGELAGIFNKEHVQNSLKKHVTSEINRTVTKIVDNKDGLTLELDDQSSILCEMVVFANHLNIGSLIPFYQDVLIPYCDQWHSLKDSNKSDEALKHMFLGFHGNIWGYKVRNKTVIGGARFLEPLARVGMDSPQISPKIKNYLESYLETQNCLEENSFIDIRPCDELPIVGPHFNNPRILLATGFMGGGNSLGFYSGKLLADLIASGASFDLPHILWPKRQRTL